MNVGSTPRSSRITVIASADQLNALRRRRLPSRVKIAPGVLPTEAAAEWQTRLNRELSVCGCHQAAFALLIVLPASALFAWWGLPEAGWWPRITTVLGVCFVTLLAVKGVVIVRARQHYRRLVSGLAERLSTPPK
jgi:hypothetical protein